MITSRSLWVKALAVVTAAGTLVFAFQNCGKAGFDQALDQVPTGTIDAMSTAAPFAFDASFDQISYNSCSGGNLSPTNGFFTLKAGAYGAGGVRVRPAFIDYAKTKLKPIYPETHITVEQIKQFVVGTPENAEAQLQMALRTQGAPQQVLSPSGSGTPTPGKDLISFLMDLTDDRIMEPLFRNAGATFNYFPLAPESNQRTMEGAFTYNANEADAKGFREKLDTVFLSLTYSAFRDSPGRARMPSGVAANSNLAYGRGYQLRFGQEIAYSTNGGTGTPNPLNPLNTLAQVTEVNYENPSLGTGANWVCDIDQRFLIVRKADAVNCPLDSFERLRDPDYRRRLEIVRRHLRADQWDVSVDRHCVVPKLGSCYATTSGDEAPVEYDQRNECYQNVDGLANPRLTNHCAQYVSICLRQ